MLRIMSHNQWKCDENLPAWESRGMDCSVETRTKGFVRVFSDVLPDIVGCQEVSFMMADLLIRKLKDEGMSYALLWGRDTPILYRPDKLELLNSEFDLFPLKCPGFDGDFNNSLTKSWNLAVFRTKNNNRTFVFITTHLWWMSDNPKATYYQKGSNFARQYQLEIVIRKAKEYQALYKCPAIIVGDFNTDYNSAALKNAFNNGFIHAHDCAVEYVDESQGYHPCGADGYKDYCTGNFDVAIDHIIINGFDDGAVKTFCRHSPEYYLPLSDHSPVYADIDL